MVFLRVAGCPLNVLGAVIPGVEAAMIRCHDPISQHIKYLEEFPGKIIFMQINCIFAILVIFATSYFLH